MLFQEPSSGVVGVGGGFIERVGGGDELGEEVVLVCGLIAVGVGDLGEIAEGIVLIGCGVSFRVSYGDEAGEGYFIEEFGEAQGGILLLVLSVSKGVLIIGVLLKEFEGALGLFFWHNLALRRKGW